MTTKSIIAERVYFIRVDDLGLTQIELAKRLNIEQSTVHRWEAQKAVPSVIQYLRLIKLLPPKDQISELEYVIERI